MIKRTWINHGTKLLGFAGVVVSSALAANSVLPPDHPLISVEQLKWFVFANLVLGALTVKRGFSNSKAQAETPQ
jgi:hypothetical protein